VDKYSIDDAKVRNKIVLRKPKSLLMRREIPILYVLQHKTVKKHNKHFAVSRNSRNFTSPNVKNDFFSIINTII